MFDPERDPVFLVNAGDYIRFIPIDESTFLEIGNDVKKGWCQVQKETLR
jgi:allophanate hydrolase subunit 1